MPKVPVLLSLLLLSACCSLEQPKPDQAAVPEAQPAPAVDNFDPNCPPEDLQPTATEPVVQTVETTPSAYPNSACFLVALALLGAGVAVSRMAKPCPLCSKEDQNANEAKSPQDKP